MASLFLKHNHDMMTDESRSQLCPQNLQAVRVQNKREQTQTLREKTCFLGLLGLPEEVSSERSCLG